MLPGPGAIKVLVNLCCEHLSITSYSGILRDSSSGMYALGVLMLQDVIHSAPAVTFRLVFLEDEEHASARSTLFERVKARRQV